MILSVAHTIKTWPPMIRSTGRRSYSCSRLMVALLSTQQHPSSSLVSPSRSYRYWMGGHNTKNDSRRKRQRHIICRPSIRLFSAGSSHQSTEQKQQRQRITYLTDVEGDAAYLDRYVRLSKVLQFVPTQPRFDMEHAATANNTNTNEAGTFQDDFSSCWYFPYDHCMDFRKDDQSMLVYGGDVWDKGGSDLYVIRQLLDFKRRYPHRVQFIMGNRDINKMRISQELGVATTTTMDKITTSTSSTEHTPQHPMPMLPHHEGVYWLRNFQQASGGDANDDSITPPSTSAPDRLRWMLARTMGSPKAFELRRLELQREKQAAAAAAAATAGHITNNTREKEPMVDFDVSDDEVVQSYRQSCHPHTGELGNYLAHAHLALRIGELLVVHGALPLTNPVLRKAVADEASGKDISDFWKDLSFAMPWMECADRDNVGNIATTTAKESIESWIIALNDFAKRSMDSWKESYNRTSDNFQDESSQSSSQESSIWALHGGYPSDMPEGQLMQYGMGWTPDGKRNPTIVYSSWGADGMPKRFYPKDDVGERKVEDEMYVRLVQDFFRQSELRLILVGHQPQGDMPLPIRIDYNEPDNRDDANSNQAKSNSFGWVLCCDTSYSGDTQWVNPSKSPQSGARVTPGRGKGPGFRGDLAVSETLVEMDQAGQIWEVYWHGVLNDGTAYESSSLPLTKDEEDSNSITVGTVAHGDWVPKEDETPHSTKWWTKAHLDHQTTLVTTAKGYEVHNCIVDRPRRQNK